jgi:hypothetical protein
MTDRKLKEWKAIWLACPPKDRAELLAAIKRVHTAKRKRRKAMLKNKFVRWGGIGCAGLLVIGVLGAILAPDRPSESEQLETAVANLQNQNAQAPTVSAATGSESSTQTPLPTATELPSPTPLPEPIVLTGSGDNVVDLTKPSGAAIVRITGNAVGSHFAVWSVDSANEHIDLLVNTTDPYTGTRPLDFRDSDHTVRFEITAVGDWTIEVLPLLSAPILTLPGTMEGTGDMVFLLDGNPDLATISGNDGGGHFAVLAYGSRSNLLVNTTDPYSGVVIVPADVLVIEVDSEGPWSIEITE